MYTKKLFSKGGCMKKGYISLVVATITILMNGCAEKKEVVSVQPQTDRCTVEGASAPDWVCVGEKFDGYYTAQGYSTASRAGHGITMDRAYNEGAGKLALTISADIKAKMTSFTATTGLDKYETVDSAFEKSVKQSASLQAQEIETLRHWEHPKHGGIYLLVGVKRDNINNRVKQNTLSSFKNDAALYQIVKMKKAEAELDKEFPTGGTQNVNAQDQLPKVSSDVQPVQVVAPKMDMKSSQKVVDKPIEG